MQDLNVKKINVYYSAIREKELTNSEALILCLFNQIGLDKKIPSNKEISRILNISSNKVSNIIKNLIIKKYIKKTSAYTDLDVFEILSKGATYTNGCKICGYSKSYLDEHHYPIRAKDGGDKTIPLCANCHREFHELADFSRNISFTSKSERLFA